MELSLLIMAAGASTRFGRDKQTVLYKGMPLFLHSVKNLGEMAEELLVVVPKGRIAEFTQLARDYGVYDLKCVEGGNTRTESVRLGLAALESNDGFVAVHDAARPLATRELLAAVLKAASATGGAIPGHRIVDTMMRTDENGIITAPIDREGAWAVSTPQVFDLKRLRAAYSALGEKSLTDDAQAFLANGNKVAIVEENCQNTKITYSQDIENLN